MKSTALANKVKELRTSKGLSQEELAVRSQLSLRTVQRIEGNETEPRGDTLKRLSTALSVPPEEMTAFNIPVNKKWWLLLNLSALGFIIFPLLGALVPFIIWRTNPDKIKGIETEARQLINFQLWWCLLLFFVFLSFLVCKVYHLPVFGQGGMFNYLFSGLYLLNFLFVVFNTVKMFWRGKPERL